MSFSVTLVYVAVMLGYAIPGFLLIKFRALKDDNIAAFSKMLLFTAQPCQVIYSFQKVEYSFELFKSMGIFFLASLTLMSIILFLTWLTLRNRQKEVSYRVLTIASFMTNCTFMGVPLLEKLLPGFPQAVVYAMLFSMAMNILAWTVSAYLISQDKKYISLKKIIINPAVMPLFVAIPLFVTKTQLPSVLGDMITLMGKMTTPLCMIILGMRLATVSFKETFMVPRYYLTVLINQVLMPLSAYLLSFVFGFSPDARKAFVIICCCPIAAIVLNITEILGKGQKTAGSIVLVGTILSIITIPVVTIIL